LFNRGRGIPGKAMRAFLRQFKGQDHTPLVQFIKYGIAGAMATLVHTVVFFLCAWIALPALGADDPLVRLLGVQPHIAAAELRARYATYDNLIAFVFSNLTAYLINIFWVFEGGRHHRLVEICMFYLFSGISLAVGTSLQWVLIHHLNIATSYAFISNIFVSLLINYATRKFVVFKG
jgi:putative flippase GtrA